MGYDDGCLLPRWFQTMIRGAGAIRVMLEDALAFDLFQNFGFVEGEDNAFRAASNMLFALSSFSSGESFADSSAALLLASSRNFLFSSDSGNHSAFLVILLVVGWIG